MKKRIEPQIFNLVLKETKGRPNGVGPGKPPWAGGPGGPWNPPANSPS